MSFIENAKKLKKEKGYTTNELSKICGIPLGTLSKLFSGIIEEPKLSAAIAISKALGTTVDALCDLTDGTYTSEEIELISKYRMLDDHGKNFANLIIANEISRLDTVSRINNTTPPSTANDHNNIQSEQTSPASPFTKEKKKAEERTAVITPTPSEYSIKSLPLYDIPVSAGIGEYLDSTNTTYIRVKNTGKVAEASYALKVTGDSMMPEYCDGDILIIKEQESVLLGELGIFICDGKGYFKKFGGDRLVSLNESYDDIMLSDFSDGKCVGLVLGRLKSKKS